MAAAPDSFERYVQYRRFHGLGFHPDGDLCYTSDISGQFNLWRQPIGAGGVPGYPTSLTGYTDRVVREFAFASDGLSVFYQADPNGDENYQLYRLWLKDGRTETLTSDPQVQHSLSGGTIDVRGGDLLYTDNSRARTDVDVVVRNLRTGAVTRPFPTGTFWAGPRFDQARKRIIALRSDHPSDIRTFVFDRKRQSLTEILPHEGETTVAAIDFTGDGRGVLLLTDLNSDFLRLVLHYPETGRTKVIAAPKADVEYAVYSRKSGTVAYATNNDGYSTVFAGKLGGRIIRRPTPKGAIFGWIWGRQFEISDDGQVVATLWGTGAAPTEVLWIPLGRPWSKFVTNGMVAGVPHAPLPAPKLVHVPAPNGRSVPCFYYVPKHPRAEPMPAVLSIHGGPHMQDRPAWAYGGLHQFLNSLGIYVLAPNYRGSTGYGRKYRELLYRDWGGVDLEDFRSCAEWLRSQKEVDSNRLAVYGGSFGGFASLSCLTRLPEYWKVGVDVFGPSNLVTFLQGVPPSWRRVMTKMLGDPKRDREFLLSRSPITYLANLRADLLVIQGGKDPRVVKSESDQLVDRLRSSGRSVQYTVFDDEGHGFSRYINQIRAMSEVGQFLADRLLPGK